MAVQNSIVNRNKPFILTGLAFSRGDQILFTDAGRTTPLLFGTLLAKIAATQKWVPFISETATDGSAFPQGVYIGPDIAAADIVAGDIADLSVLVGGGGVSVDADQVVIENSKTLNTIIDAVTVTARTVKDQLSFRGIFIEDTIEISSQEN